MSTPRFKILHTADSHVGADLPTHPRWPGPRRGDDFIESFNCVLRRARADQVDLLIHAGDLYDSPTPSNSAILAAVLPLRTLADEGVAILIVPGNHERYLLPASPFLVHPNITIVQGPCSHVYARGDTRILVAAVPCIRRGAGATFAAALEKTGWRDHEADARVLVAHQAFDSAVCGPADYRFPKKSPDVVSRESIPPEFDYVAAGHIHRHQKLRPADRLTPRIVYAGSNDRITFAERDEPKGCVLIELDSTGLTHRFIGHAVRPMSVWPIAISGFDKGRLLSQIDDIVMALPPRAIAEIRIGGVTDRAAFAGLRLRERVRDMRPDTLVNINFRGIDFARPTVESASQPVGALASAFDLLEHKPSRIHSATPTSLAALPRLRGVYAMYDAAGRLLYIGKATDLRARARSHLAESAATNFFQGWTSQVARLESILAGSDEEALSVEAELIRRHRPPFNWFGT